MVMTEWLNHLVAGAGVWAYVIIGLGVGLECAVPIAPGSAE